MYRKGEVRSEPCKAGRKGLHQILACLTLSWEAELQHHVTMFNNIYNESIFISPAAACPQRMHVPTLVG